MTAKDITQLMKRASEQGFQTDLAKNGRSYLVTAKSGLTTRISTNLGSTHAYANAVRSLKRLGFTPEHVPPKLRKRTSQPMPESEKIDVPGFEQDPEPDVPSARMERITPEIALDLLTASNENRTLRRSHVIRLSSDMTGGRWRTTGEPIIIDREGRLLDGQHRLNAIIEAEVTLDFMVVRGVEPDVQRAIDQGVARTASDQIRFSGAGGYAPTIAAGIRLYLRYTSGVPSREISNSRINEEYDNDPGGWETAAWWGAKVYGALRRGSAAAYTVAWYVLSRIDFDATEAFFSNLIDMRFGDEGDPIRALHRALSRLDVRRTKISEDALNYVLRAWQRWRAGVSVSTLLLKQNRDDSPLPRPEDLR